MGNLFSRVKRRLFYTLRTFENDCNFSGRLAAYRVADELGGRLHLKRIAQEFHERKERWISEYLQNLLAPIWTQFAEDQDVGEPCPNAPIWVCWWTGEETAPPLVRQCIRSIRANAGDHPVHLIDKDNYAQFLELPDYMLEKVAAGEMGLAHLSDYIRVALVAEYGGLWLDATIFCSQPVPEDYFAMPLFTCKNEVPSGKYLSRMQWTTFVLGGWKGNVFFRCLKGAFEAYWQQEETAIDYLFFDHLIALARDQVPAAGRLLAQVNANNPHRDDLQAAMNRAAAAVEWDSIVRPDTVLYKLSWRETYSETTPTGEESVYGYFFKKEI